MISLLTNDYNYYLVAGYHVSARPVQRMRVAL